VLPSRLLLSALASISLALLSCTQKTITTTAIASGRLFLGNLKPANVQLEPNWSAGIAGQLVVLFKDGAVQTIGAQALGQSLSSIAGVKAVTAHSGMALVQSDPKQIKALAAAIAGRSDVAAVGPNYRYSPQAVPNDTAFAQQWNLKMMGLEDAWDVEKGKDDVLVAVIDGGYNPNIADLKARIALPTPPDGYFLDPAGVSLDEKKFSGPDNDPKETFASSVSGLGHGTASAGIIAATTDNASGIAGITWQGVKVVPIKIFDDDGGGTTASVAAGIDTAIQVKAGVANLSLGITDGPGGSCTGKRDSVVDAAMQRAYEAGVFITASSGNYSQPLMCYPASSRYAMSVGSNDQQKQRSSFSNYGPFLDIIAPGSCVPALASKSNCGFSLGGNAFGVSGTSFSSPSVAAVAALLKSNGLSSPDVIYGRLVSTTEDIGALGRDDQTGNGLVRADLALKGEAGFAASETYPLVAMAKQGSQITQTFNGVFRKGRNASAYQFTDLKSGQYTVQVLVDVNSNGVEDAGDYAGTTNIEVSSKAIYGQDMVLSVQ
jgi:subtilisin family serine protease